MLARPSSSRSMTDEQLKNVSSIPRILLFSCSYVSHAYSVAFRLDAIIQSTSITLRCHSRSRFTRSLGRALKATTSVLFSEGRHALPHQLLYHLDHNDLILFEYNERHWVHLGPAANNNKHASLNELSLLGSLKDLACSTFICSAKHAVIIALTLHLQRI